MAALAVPALLGFLSPVYAQPVVQPIPGPEAGQLNSALSRLARNPRDVAAMIDAGNAALALGDFAAAEGFYRRAGEAEPNNAAAKAGLAQALTLGGDPYSAIPLFDDAARAGANPAKIAAARGLAYDLVGANALAQEQYRLVLAGDEDGEIRRRLALSLAIGGDGAAAEAMLMPLLRQQDKPAWRTRAFILAILGKRREAEEVTNTLLPASLASSIVPYLRYMPQLTPAQQAAAANLGRFPRASEIGRDDPRIAAFASLATPRAKVAAVDAALVPQGEPLGSGRKRSSRRQAEQPNAGNEAGRTSRSRRETRSQRAEREALALAAANAARVAPPDPRPARESVPSSRPDLAPAAEAQDTRIVSATPANPPASEPEPAAPQASAGRQQVAAAPAGQPASRQLPVDSAQPGASAAAQPVAEPPAQPPPKERSPAAPKADVAASGAPSPNPVTATGSTPPQGNPATPGFDLAALPGANPAGTGLIERQAASPTPTSPAAREVVQEVKPGFASLFGDLGTPTTKAAPAAGAVDIRKIEPAKPKPPPEPVKPPPKPAPPSHPSRIWVQLGIGQNQSALKFDWRKLNRQQAAIFKGRKAWISDMGQTNRMLTGPFESRKAANDFLAELAKAGLDDPYLWISPAGQVVEPLSD